METFDFTQGSMPLLVSMPHNGTAIPEDISSRMTVEARRVPDTDWHLDRLYDFAGSLGASILKPVYSRYVIDLNRPPDGSVLYPGSSNTELCPLSCFDTAPIYLEKMAPEPEEILNRIETYWRPYHDQLERELGRLISVHGVALLYEAHSIRSKVPRFFKGRLPDLNLGTAAGKSCAPRLQRLLRGVLESARGYTFAVNRRFKGGYNTRHYGKPSRNIHAVQLEQAQISYMDEAYPFAYDEARAKKVKPVLRQLLETMLVWVAERA